MPLVSKYDISSPFIVSVVEQVGFSLTGSNAPKIHFNSLVTNGISHPCQLDESTSIFRGVRSNYSFLSHFRCKLTQKPQMGRRVLRRHIWGYSVKKEARLIWVKVSTS